jgi:hypothetical protein
VERKPRFTIGFVIWAVRPSQTRAGSSTTNPMTHP